MNSERRIKPRYPVNFPVHISVINGTTQRSFPATALNISQTAIELDCDAAALKGLQAQGNYPQPCELQVPLPKARDQISVRCQLHRFRRLSQHRYQLVLVFVEAFPVPVQELDPSEQELVSRRR